MIPSSENYLSEQKISEFVDGKFFRCVGKFLSWLRLGETYWFEYIGNDYYIVRSDNNLGKKFEMIQHQLLTNFFPVNCETDKLYAMKYCHRLGELGIHHGYIDDIYNAYRKFQSEKPSEELEEAAEEYSGKSSHPLNNAFKDGANWRIEQIMQGLCYETKVYRDEEGDGIDTPIESWLALENNEITNLPNIGLKEGDRVKIIIVKDNEQ